jgi:hypothetical protein
MGAGAADIIVIVLREVGYGSNRAGLTFHRPLPVYPNQRTSPDRLDAQC